MAIVDPNKNSLLSTLILPVAQALHLRGIDPLELLDAVGIDVAKAANPEWRIPQSSFAALMVRCVEETGDEAFGLLAAEQLRPQVLHGLGLGWLASDTVYEGLARLVRFGKLLSSALELELEPDGQFIHLCMSRSAELDRYSDVGKDYAVGIVVRMCRLTLGEFLAPVSIEINRPQPRHPDRWEYMLASRVSFDTGITRVTWSRSDILQPLITGDPALARANDEQAQTYLNSFQRASVSRSVVDKIVERLPDGPPSQQQVADALNVSNRTLQRKLQEEGTSFMDLLQDTRLELARQYLAQPNYSVVETAYLLGFSESSTFSRAFKRWTGMAPADFRQNQQPD
tara:strand:+ start:64391 stop:65416 length:1026 start_codon:yes stop_codon:yes gene_type:complete